MTEYGRLITLVERTEYSIAMFPFSQILISEQYEFIEVSGDRFRVTVTGFLICDECIVVVFPKGFSIPASPAKEAATLLRVLLRYRNSRNLNQDEIRMLRGNRQYKSGRLASAVALLDDYQVNGYLSRAATTRTSGGNGFIDWNRTVKTAIPVIASGKPVYLTPVLRMTKMDPDNVISRIHRAVISECLSLFGWLFGFDDANSNNLIMPVPVGEALDILEAELESTFVHREIDVLKMMIQYLSAKVGQESHQGVELLATPYFHNTWEAVCGFVFQNQYAGLKHLVPQPSWKNAIVSGTISQRPDILYIHNRSLYVLDAKYYDYTSSLPGWHDIVKQLFYQFTFEKSCKQKRYQSGTLADVEHFRNVFILPENSQNDFVHLGDISVDSVEELDTLYVFAINFSRAMDLYARGARADYRSTLELKLNELNAM